MRPMTMLLALGAALPALAQAPEWRETAGVRYLCGGVGQGSFAEVRSLRAEASVELLLTYGARGGYLADVTVTIGGAGLDRPVIVPREGPLCLFKLPPGRYTVSAEHGAQTIERALSVGEGLSALHLNFRE